MPMTDLRCPKCGSDGSLKTPIYNKETCLLDFICAVCTAPVALEPMDAHLSLTRRLFGLLGFKTSTDMNVKAIV